MASDQETSTGMTVASGASTSAGATLGTALAHEAVSQAAAIVVQDAAAYLRQMGQISAAGMAVCTELMIAQKDPVTYTPIMAQITTNLTAATTAFQAMGTAASAVASKFPAS